ncbi:MAG: integrase/recombinase XerD [Kiritimatiellia bacterium]|jgi:integrase/recombinase XerD
MTHRHTTLLFSAGKTSIDRQAATFVMDRGGLQKFFEIIVKSCGIHKPITPHNPRHYYGAHLVECCVNLRAIQHEMGHECPNIIALYTPLTEVTRQDTGKLINKMLNRLHLV